MEFGGIFDSNIENEWQYFFENFNHKIDSKFIGDMRFIIFLRQSLRSKFVLLAVFYSYNWF